MDTALQLTPTVLHYNHGADTREWNLADIGLTIDSTDTEVMQTLGALLDQPVATDLTVMRSGRAVVIGTEPIYG